jgi:glucosamine kinase
MAGQRRGGGLFLGVDGGGTKTRARLRDAGGGLLGEGAGGPGNAHLGMAAFSGVMQACRGALAAARVPESDFGLVHAGFGLAGTQPKADRDAVLAWPHPFASLAVDTDAYAAYLGAFLGEEGAILILGTGSCGLAMINGRRLTVGGWGAEIGDDGSGRSIGKMAVRRALLAYDGMAIDTPLAEELLAFFGRSPENIVAWAGTAIPADYAKFAPTVFSHAEQGDALAREIVAEAARGATMYVDRLAELGATTIAMIGGIFPHLLPWLPARVKPLLVQPQADTMDGAIIMAQRALASTGPGQSRA